MHVYECVEMISMILHKDVTQASQPKLIDCFLYMPWFFFAYRVVRVATHPDVTRMGYGSRAMELLLKHFKGELLDLDAPLDDGEDEEDESEDEDEETGGNGSGAAAEDSEGDDEEEDEDDDDEEGEEDGEAVKGGSSKKAARKALRREKVAPRAKLPPLLVPCSQRRPPALHWAGVSFGVTSDLLNYWLRLGFELCYLRQTPNETTGEHTAVLLLDLQQDHSSSGSSSSGSSSSRSSSLPTPKEGWLSDFVTDARRRLVSLLAFAFRSLSTGVALGLLGGGAASRQRPRLGFDGGGGAAETLTAADLSLFLTPHDMKRCVTFFLNDVIRSLNLITCLVDEKIRRQEPGDDLVSYRISDLSVMIQLFHGHLCF
jgi:N-acetyltransferase 10